MSEIKKVTLNELAKLDTWKIRDVDRKTFLLIANKINYKHTSGFPYDDNEFLSIYNYESKDVTWSARDDGYFNRHDHSEVKLIEENEVKKVDLQYLLDNDKWQLKVTPEQSEMVQLALFDVGVTWSERISEVKYLDEDNLSREHDYLFYGNGLKLEQLELEEQTPQNDFDTQQEIFRWLDDGGEIREEEETDTVKFVDGFLLKNNRACLFSFFRPSEWKKVTSWYDKLDGTIDNGRLCNIDINNSTDSTNTTRLIIDMSSDDSLFYSDEGIAYDNATPLTNDEIKAFMVGGSDE